MTGDEYCMYANLKLTLNKWKLSVKAFAQQRETINKRKRQPTEWEKIFANDVTNKGSIPQICQQFIQFTVKKKKNNPTSKCFAEDINRQFSKEDIQVANRHMKKCSASLIIREI